MYTHHPSPHGGRAPGDTVNVRVVRILLECIVVLGVKTLAVGIGVAGGFLVLLVPLVVFTYINHRKSTNQKRQQQVHFSTLYLNFFC